MRIRERDYTYREQIYSVYILFNIYIYIYAPENVNYYTCIHIMYYTYALTQLNIRTV